MQNSDIRDTPMEGTGRRVWICRGQEGCFNKWELLRPGSGDLVLSALPTASVTSSLTRYIWPPLKFSTQLGLFLRKLPYTVPFVCSPSTPFLTDWLLAILPLLAYPSPPQRSPPGPLHWNRFLFHPPQSLFSFVGHTISFFCHIYNYAIICLFTPLRLHSRL